MSDEQKPKPENLENLELNKETVQDLNELDTEAVQGGFRPAVASAADCTDFVR